MVWIAVSAPHGQLLLTSLLSDRGGLQLLLVEDGLERRPTVDIQLEAIRTGLTWYAPITNKGAGVADLYSPFAKYRATSTS